MILATIAEVSALYRIPPGTLRRWIAEGRVTAHGKRPGRIDLHELDAVLDAIGAGRNRATRGN